MNAFAIDHEYNWSKQNVTGTLRSSRDGKRTERKKLIHFEAWPEKK